jgi:hypothetical protein
MKRRQLILAQCKVSVTRRGGVMTSAGGQAASGREKRGDDASLADVNLIRSKNKENLHD